VGVGLAIVLQLYRLRQTVAVDELALAEADEPVGTAA
jgi:NADH-quinone oxidoreductase subunit K